MALDADIGALNLRAHGVEHDGVDDVGGPREREPAEDEVLRVGVEEEGVECRRREAAPARADDRGAVAANGHRRERGGDAAAEVEVQEPGAAEAALEHGRDGKERAQVREEVERGDVRKGGADERPRAPRRVLARCDQVRAQRALVRQEPPQRSHGEVDRRDQGEVLLSTPLPSQLRELHPHAKQPDERPPARASHARHPKIRKLVKSQRRNRRRRQRLALPLREPHE
mmetsp:Transcript_15193/g.49859  ORF Transcript_15193/g.49859 Transcript_15193/m.49859 type:complete len:228 (+) Transcript_15193:149-832(+)